MPDKLLVFHTSSEMHFKKEDRIIRGVEIMRTGTFRPGNWGGRSIKVTDKYIEDTVKNYHELKDAGIFTNIPHRLDHSWSVSAIAGYILDARKVGDRLVVDVEFTSDKAYALFEEGTLRNRSAEIGAYTDNDGNKYEPVLRGFAWVDIPAVEKLGDVIAASGEKLDILWLEGDEDVSSLLDKFMKENGDLKTVVEDLRAKLSRRKQEEKNMTVKLGDIAKFVTHDGTEITSLKGIELPAPELIELDHEGETLIFGDDRTREKFEAQSKEVAQFKETAEKAEKQTRVDFVATLKKEGKILGSEETIKSEEEFVDGMTQEQFATYRTRMEKQPKLIELDKAPGDQEPGDKDKSPELKQAEAGYAAYLRSGGQNKNEIAHYKERIKELGGEVK